MVADHFVRNRVQTQYDLVQPLDISYGQAVQHEDLSVSSFSVSFSRSEATASTIVVSQLLPLSLLKHASPLQAIVFYLRKHNHSFADIARLLNRDQRTIWCTYNAAKHLFPETQTDDTNDYSEYMVPLDIFASRELSALEHIVFYLKEQHNVTLSEIALHVGRNYHTIRTAYLRALNKISKSKSIQSRDP